MKANYTPKQATVQSLVMSLDKLNMLLYNRCFGCKTKACVTLVKLINQIAADYDEYYEGYGHEKALAESLEKKDISIRLISFPNELYRKYREVIRFYLNLTAKALLERNHSKQEVKNYLREFQAVLAKKNWTEGKAVRELDEMLLKNINTALINGVIL